MTTVWFDTETGGLTPAHPTIWLAGIAVNPTWTELETFDFKIQFDEATADPEALKMNHYDPAVWAREAVPEDQALTMFAAFLGRHKSIEMISKRTKKPYSVARLAGHNAATFDGPRLKDDFQRYGMFLPAHPLVMCSLQRAMWYAFENGTKFENLKLETLARHFGVPVDDTTHCHHSGDAGRERGMVGVHAESIGVSCFLPW